MKVYQDYILTFKFVKENIINIYKHIDLQSQEIYVEFVFSKKSLHILEDGASSVQVDILNKSL